MLKVLLNPNHLSIHPLKSYSQIQTQMSFLTLDKILKADDLFCKFDIFRTITRLKFCVVNTHSIRLQCSLSVSCS